MPRINFTMDGQPWGPYAKRPDKPASGNLAMLLEARDPDHPPIWDRATAMKRYPRITAHIICCSLGYATPSVAAQILADAMNGHDNWCEWIDACYQRDPREAVRHAIRSRACHSGYMAEYPRALLLVAAEMEGIDHGCELASWF